MITKINALYYKFGGVLEQIFLHAYHYNNVFYLINFCKLTDVLYNTFKIHQLGQKSIL